MHSHTHEPPAKAERDALTAERFAIAAETVKQLADPTRMRVFLELCHKELCVSALASLLVVSSPAVFHHLRSLKEHALLESRRAGKEVYYRAADSELCRLLHRTVEELLAVSCPQEHEDSAEEIARSAHEYLVTHLSERITIDTLSHKFAINPTTLKQAFKEVYGDAIASHVTAHRMEKAQRLLKTTSAPVAHIAKEVGYESQSRFTAAYRRRYGHTPTEERERG